MDEISKELESHGLWLRGDPGGRRAVLRRADLRGADLRGADLRGADLRGADLRGADLRDADLRDADLRRADLRDADLRGADLRDADLRRADLRDADLRGAYLRDAGSWDIGPPMMSAGPWYGICLAPGVVQIGCTTLAPEEWLASGAELIHEHSISPMDAQMLRHWLLMLDAAGDDIPGWRPRETEL